MMNRIRMNDNRIEMLQFPRLGRDCNIFHFVTTRHGGVSHDAFAGFNLGEYAGDEETAWQNNRRVLCDACGICPEQLFVPYQTHGISLLDLDCSFLSLSQAEQKNKLYGVDALVTTVPGVCIAVTTADCVPLLLYAPDKQVVAAVHAGWRGTVAGITTRTVRYLLSQYGCDPAQIQVGIGPCISFEVFEVGDEVVVAFEDILSRMPDTCNVHPETGKSHLDLTRINAGLLREEGVLPENIEFADLCTYTHEADFFSARRQGIHSGRMLSGIGIK
ncbi:MAG: peptidoglycan editing factor PgeF [Tannerellaceae bacterium]|nr:peptidoglycan editing factor PgeF [Tannerellaceae bacterium]